jgi:hypothetical protein
MESELHIFILRNYTIDAGSGNLNNYKKEKMMPHKKSQPALTIMNAVYSNKSNNGVVTNPISI